VKFPLRIRERIHYPTHLTLWQNLSDGHIGQQSATADSLSIKHTYTLQNFNHSNSRELSALAAKTLTDRHSLKYQLYHHSVKWLYCLVAWKNFKPKLAHKFQEADRFFLFPFLFDSTQQRHNGARLPEAQKTYDIQSNAVYMYICVHEKQWWQNKSRPVLRKIPTPSSMQFAHHHM